MSSSLPVLVAAAVAASLATVGCDKVPLLAPTNSSITLTSSVGVLPTNGSAELTAVVIESAGTPVQNGTVVTFSASLGTVEPREARTTNGSVTVTYLSGAQSGTARIQAFSGGSRAEELEILVGAAAAGALTIRANPAAVSASGGTTEIVATVVDTGGNPLRGAPVTFSTTRGQLSQSTALSNDQGEARTSLTTSTEAVVTARVGAGESAATAEVTVQARTIPAVTIAVGTGTTPGGTGTAEVGLPTVFTLTPPSAETANPIREVIVNFGDGTVRNLGPLPVASTVSHTYTRAGTYTVTATATDVMNFTATTSIAVTVNERATVPITLQLLSLSAGLATFSASGVPPTGAGSIRLYEWEFGDGSSAVTTGNTTSHRYNPGTYVVRVRVVTTTGHEGFAELTVRVTA
jgi:PKD repeat protein